MPGMMRTACRVVLHNTCTSFHHAHSFTSSTDLAYVCGSSTVDTPCTLPPVVANSPRTRPRASSPRFRTCLMPTGPTYLQSWAWSIRSCIYSSAWERNTSIRHITRSGTLRWVGLRRTPSSGPRPMPLRTSTWDTRASSVPGRRDRTSGQAPDKA